MPDPQDMTGIEKMVADSRAAGKPVKVKDLATAIRQQFNPPGELSDGAVVKHFGAANPQLGMDQLQFDLSDQAAPSSHYGGRGGDQSTTSSHYGGRGGDQSTTALADFSGGRTAPPPSSPLSTPLLEYADPDIRKHLAAIFNSMPPPPSMPSYQKDVQSGTSKPVAWLRHVLGGTPEREGQVVDRTGLLGIGATSRKEAFPGEAQQKEQHATDFTSGFMSGMADSAVDMTSPINLGMLAISLFGAPEGLAAKFPKLIGLTQKLITGGFTASMLGDLSQELPNVAAMANSGDYKGAGRAAAKAAMDLLLAPRTASSMVERSAPKPSGGAQTAPPPELPATTAGPQDITPDTPSAAAPPAPRNDRVIQVLRREGTKKPVSIDRIRTITGADTRTAGKIMSQLLEDGVIDSSRNVLAGAPAATTAPPPPPAAPAATATAPPPAPPIGLPVVNTAPPAAPTGSTLRVVPLPAATEVPTVSIPTPQSIAQGVIPTIRQAAMAAQGTTPPPTVTPEQLAAAEVMQHGPAGVPGSPAPVVQMPSPAAAPAPPEAAGAPPAPVIQMPTPDEAPVNPRSAAAKKAWATRRAKAGTAPPPEPVASAGRTEPEASAQPPEPAAPVVSAAEEAAALQRIKSKFSKFAKDTTGTQYYDWKRPGEEGAELGPEDFQDLYTIGKGIVRRAGESFEDWKNQFAAAISMPIEQFRAFLEPHLMPIWQQVTQGARPDGAAGPPPGAASTAAAALPPSQPQYLQWDALHGGKPAPTPPPPDVPPPPGAASWQQWLQSVQAQGMPPEEIERRAAAATEPRIQGPLVPAGRVPLSEFEYKGAPTAIQNPSAKLPPTQPPPTAAKNPILANVGASPSGRMQAFQQAMANSGVAPLPPEAGDALEQTGFAERQNVFTGGGSGSGKKSLLSPVVLRDLPTGSRASEVWTKPVQEGTIEIQRNGSSGEFTATKYYTDGTQHTIHGIGDDSLRDYLQGVQQRELPRRQSQQVSRSSIGAPPFDTSRIATGPPPEGMTTQQTADAVAEAVRNLERSTRSAPTIAEIQRIIMNATQRSQSEQAKPPDKRMPIPEKLAQGVTDITGGQALDVNRITRIISDAVARRRVAEGLQAPEKTAGPLPADIPIVDTGTKAVQRRVKVPEESQFAVADKGAGNWLVTPKDGGETNVFIQKEEGSRFFNVYIGNRLMRKTSTLTAAKLEAVNLAEQQAEAGEGIKRQRGRPSNTPLPKVVVTPVAAPAARKISLPQQ